MKESKPGEYPASPEQKKGGALGRAFGKIKKGFSEHERKLTEKVKPEPAPEPLAGVQENTAGPVLNLQEQEPESEAPAEAAPAAATEQAEQNTRPAAKKGSSAKKQKNRESGPDRSLQSELAKWLERQRSAERPAGPVQTNEAEPSPEIAEPDLERVDALLEARPGTGEVPEVILREHEVQSNIPADLDLHAIDAQMRPQEADAEAKGADTSALNERPLNAGSAEQSPPSPERLAELGIDSFAPEQAGRTGFKDRLHGWFRPRAESRVPKPAETPVPAEEQKSPEEAALDEARAEYLRVYNQAKTGFGSLNLGKLGDLGAAEQNYKAVRKELAFKLLDAKDREIMGNGDFANEEERLAAQAKMAAARAELFQKFIVGERGILREGGMDQWPPQERHLFKKLVDGYLSVNPKLRLAGTTVLLSLGALATGGLGAAATFGAMRFGRALVSGFAGQSLGLGASKLAERTVFKGSRTKRASEMEQLKTNFETLVLDEQEEQYLKLMEEAAKEERVKLAIRAAVATLTTLGISYGTAHLGGHAEQPASGRSAAEIPERAPAAPEAGTHAPEAVRPVPSMPVPETHAPIAEHPAQVTDIPTESAPNPAEHPVPPPAPKLRIQSPELSVDAERVEARLAEGHRLQIGEVQKGEGIWHAVHRQMEERVSRHPDEFGLKTEDLADAKKVAAAVNHRTGQLIAEQDLQKTWIAKPGVHVLVEEDGHINIEGEGRTTMPAPETGPVAEVPAHPDFETAPPLPAEQMIAAMQESQAGFVEAVKPGGFSGVFAHQMDIHAHDTWAGLSKDEQAAAAFYAYSHGANVETDLPGGGRGVNFEKFFQDKGLVEESAQFGREAWALRALNFQSNEMLNQGYTNVIRELPVREFWDHFETKPGPNMGPQMGDIEEFAHSGETAKIALSEGYLKLLGAIKSHIKIDPSTAAMSIKEFVKNKLEQ